MAFGDSIPVGGGSIAVGGNEVTREIVLCFGQINGSGVVHLNPIAAKELALEILRKVEQRIEEL